MKQIGAFFLFITLFSQAQSQTTTNVVFFDRSGAVNDNPKTAYFFSCVKQYPDYCQKLYYGVHAPLQKVWTYTDTNLNVLQGSYYEYAADGTLSIKGWYENNLKEDEWHYYNDTGKVLLEEKYKKGILISSVDPDTVKKEKLLKLRLYKYL